MYLLGYDIGSSSLKAALVDAETGEVVATASHPETEMEMLSLQSGWAEQLPEVWWQNLCIVTKKLLEKSGVNAADLGAIGIGYQMHGLVTVDKDGKAIRPAIIWCDSRAVDIGEQAFREIGPDYCLQHYLNSPGNFTASKLKWVKDNEPALYEQIKYFMLPGDYIAYRLTGEAMTTVSGLSEGILWDFAA
ncbi:MAG: carbohydrate kinase, partial [Saprospiraceae bacterium]|nr:carbohydrate kinase [Saprospiraceae bacterium]